MSRHTLNKYHDSQCEQLSTLMNEITRLQKHAPPLMIITRSAEPDYDDHAGALQSEVCRIASTMPNPVFRGALKQGAARALKEHPHRIAQRALKFENKTLPATCESHSKLDSDVQFGDNIVTGWSRSVVKNLFGTFSISSEVCQRAKSRNKVSDDLDCDDFVRTTAIRIHPARWLIRLGVSYGLQFAAQEHSQRWMHTLTTFRAVPDDAAIFSACYRGDLEGVTKLFTDGQASIWDTNTDGMTPLHVCNHVHVHLSFNQCD